MPARRVEAEQVRVRESGEHKLVRDFCRFGALQVFKRAIVTSLELVILTGYRNWRRFSRTRLRARPQFTYGRSRSTHITLSSGATSLSFQRKPRTLRHRAIWRRRMRGLQCMSNCGRLERFMDCRLVHRSTRKPSEIIKALRQPFVPDLPAFGRGSLPCTNSASRTCTRKRHR